MYRSFLKRSLDLLGAGLGLLLFSPLLVAIAGALRVTIGRPIFFRQQRPGLAGRPFEMIKFRTMSDARDESGELLPDEQRMTRVGTLLRKTSLDELPELWNVLRGDMSLVGPRPLLMRYLERYSDEQMRRHEVKPGLTGWAQINGRNAISWEEKFALDVWYVDHWTVTLDLKIIFLTIWKILRREGITAAEHVTMPEFQGKSESNE